MAEGADLSLPPYHTRHTTQARHTTQQSPQNPQSPQSPRAERGNETQSRSRTQQLPGHTTWITRAQTHTQKATSAKWFSRLAHLSSPLRWPLYLRWPSNPTTAAPASRPLLPPLFPQDHPTKPLLPTLFPQDHPTKPLLPTLFPQDHPTKPLLPTLFPQDHPRSVTDPEHLSTAQHGHQPQAITPPTRQLASALSAR